MVVGLSGIPLKWMLRDLAWIVQLHIYPEVGCSATIIARNREEKRKKLLESRPLPMFQESFNGVKVGCKTHDHGSLG